MIRIAGSWHIDAHRQHAGYALLEIRHVRGSHRLLLGRNFSCVALEALGISRVVRSVGSFDSYNFRRGFDAQRKTERNRSAAVVIELANEIFEAGSSGSHLDAPGG